MQKEEKTRSIKTPEVMLILIKQLNYMANIKEIKLQKEERGSIIAHLQGFLAGVHSYKDTMRNSGYIFDVKFDSTEERIMPYFNKDDDCLIKVSELRRIAFSIDTVTASEPYKTFKELWDDAVKEKKDELFYFSEKGRDLHFAKGWYEAMKWVDITIDRVHTELEQAKEKLSLDDD